MVNLKISPFNLNDEQVAWVESIILSMTIEEKIGQLFINLTLNRDPEYIESVCRKYHIGGVRWQGGTVEEVYEQNRLFFTSSKVPVLFAANCEAGGNGAIKEGTMIASHAACGACATTDIAREMGRVSGIEAAAIGCNWMFAPISDVLLNWRNTIVNTRSFGNDPDRVIAMCKAYMAGVAESNIACCTKHFPGDGVDERDHHLLMGCNDLSCEDWDQTFGSVYRELFAYGLESVMVGHICLPAYSRKLRPDIKDEEIMPATLAPELLNGLLREQLGFNGVIVTDASHMAGLTCAAPRSQQVPGTIAAGCDMFLFFHDPDEDFQYMMNGYKSGSITEERLSDALHRILGLKAKQGLNNYKFPERSDLSKIGCQEHFSIAEMAANESVTLIKDTQALLPVDPSKHKRVKLYFVESAPVSYTDGIDPAKAIVIEELERVGFQVTAHTDYYEMEMQNPGLANRFQISHAESAATFKDHYDLVLMFFHMKGYAQENNVRLKWSASHSSELPWFVHEVPTIGVSLNYTNHLYDLPMLKTYINAYAPTREYIRSCIEKIVGRSDFKGQYNDNVWCGRWDTRL
jgi:beta-glucosidase-like glycosyl hydrolase